MRPRRTSVMVLALAVALILGGLADTDASIYFWRADTGYWLQVTVHKKPGLGGPALGIPRALRIHVRTPIDAAAVSIAGS